ncbi:MAG: hypothetical protein R3208_11060 [Ketobacteraceae bacterium]|nr:hypothetical protein [Ketobacteraceae bacterium]
MASVDRLEMIQITQRCSLKSYVTHKRLSRDSKSAALKSLFARSTQLYLEIYGLLGRLLPASNNEAGLFSLPDFSLIAGSDSDRSRLEKVSLLDAYVLDLLRLVITRIEDRNIRYPLSSKVASLQIIHDRMKELQA